MKQQINLYQPLFRKQKVVFSAVAMLQVLALVVGMLAAISAYTAFSLSRLEKQLADARGYQEMTQKNVDQLLAKQQSLTPSKLLEDEVTRTRAELSERREVARLLSEGALSNITGFSQHFESLARHHATGTWLTEISLRQGGAWVNLRGTAVSPEIVPAYLQGLLAAQAFGAVKFNVLNLQVLPGDKTWVWFEAGTGEKAEPRRVATTATNTGGSNAVAGISRRAN